MIKRNETSANSSISELQQPWSTSVPWAPAARQGLRATRDTPIKGKTRGAQERRRVQITPDWGTSTEDRRLNLQPVRSRADKMVFAGI